MRGVTKNHDTKSFFNDEDAFTRKKMMMMQSVRASGIMYSISDASFNKRIVLLLLQDTLSYHHNNNMILLLSIVFHGPLN